MTESIYMDYLKEVSGNEHYKNRLLKVLFGLIEIAPLKRPKNSNGSFESHHIVPKSWKPEWNKISENRVLLSTKAHYVVHHLMWKAFTKDWKMIEAFKRMFTSQQKQRITSRVFEQLKKDWNIINSEKMIRYWSIPENKKVQSERNSGKNNGMYGQTHSKEARKKISDMRKLKGGTHFAHHSEETKQKIKEITLKQVSDKNMGCYIRCSCLICRKETNIIAFTRFHNHKSVN